MEREYASPTTGDRSKRINKKRRITCDGKVRLIWQVARPRGCLFLETHPAGGFLTALGSGSLPLLQVHCNAKHTRHDAGEKRRKLLLRRRLINNGIAFNGGFLSVRPAWS